MTTPTRQVLILLLALFVVSIGFGITLPVLPVYVERLALGRGVGADLVAVHIGLLTGVYALAQVVAAPLWGRLSDRYGRKPLMLIGMSGYAVSLVVFGGAGSLAGLYGARVVGGLFSAALLPIAAAFLSDRMTGTDRSRSLAWMNTAISLGVVGGPAISGLLTVIDWHLELRFASLHFDGFSMPFLAAAGLAVVSVALLGGSMRDGVYRATITQSEAAPWGLARDRRLRRLLGLTLAAQLALAVFESTFVLFARSRLELSLLEIGYGFAVCGVVMAVAQGGVFVMIVSRLGEESLIVIGLIITSAGLGLLLAVDGFAGAMIAIGVIALGIALVSPALLALVAADHRTGGGVALGLQSSAGGMGQFVGAFVGGSLYALQVDVPYLVAAVLMFMAALWALWNRVELAEAQRT